MKEFNLARVQSRQSGHVTERGDTKWIWRAQMKIGERAKFQFSSLPVCAATDGGESRAHKLRSPWSRTANSLAGVVTRAPKWPRPPLSWVIIIIIIIIARARVKQQRERRNKSASERQGSRLIERPQFGATDSFALLYNNIVELQWNVINEEERRQREIGRFMASDRDDKKALLQRAPTESRPDKEQKREGIARSEEPLDRTSATPRSPNVRSWYVFIIRIIALHLAPMSRVK